MGYADNQIVILSQSVSKVWTNPAKNGIINPIKSRREWDL